MDWPAELLRKVTDDFNDGNRIGEGGFGPVFKGKLWGTIVAIKVLRLKSDTDFNERMAQDQYKTEIDILTRFRHPNLLALLGYSKGNHRQQQQCLVYEYMDNGSLEDALDPKTRKQLLESSHRLAILRDAARGLVFLHCAKLDAPLVHRDVKSANVLLDTHYNAKVGDFGLARVIGQDGHGSKTSKVMGTSGYIAPEYLHGRITPKIDVYAFGVVILEAITSLPSYDNNRKDAASLMMYIKEQYSHIRHAHWLKEKIRWPESVAEDLSRLASLCLMDSPDRRPSMEQVLECLEEIRSVAMPKALLDKLSNATRQPLQHPGKAARDDRIEEVDEQPGAVSASQPVADPNISGKLVLPSRGKHGGQEKRQRHAPSSQPPADQHSKESNEASPVGSAGSLKSSAARGGTISPTQQPQQVSSEDDCQPLNLTNQPNSTFGDSLSDVLNRSQHGVPHQLMGTLPIGVTNSGANRPAQVRANPGQVAAAADHGPPSHSTPSHATQGHPEKGHGSAMPANLPVSTRSAAPLADAPAPMRHAPSPLLQRRDQNGHQAYPEVNVDEHHSLFGDGAQNRAAPSARSPENAVAGDPVFRNFKDDELYGDGVDEDGEDASRDSLQQSSSDMYPTPHQVSENSGDSCQPATIVTGNASYAQTPHGDMRFRDRYDPGQANDVNGGLQWAPSRGSAHSYAEQRPLPPHNSALGGHGAGSSVAALAAPAGAAAAAASPLSHDMRNQGQAVRHIISQPVSESDNVPDTPAHAPLNQAYMGRR